MKKILERSSETINWGNNHLNKEGKMRIKMREDFTELEKIKNPSLAANQGMVTKNSMEMTPLIREPKYSLIAQLAKLSKMSA